jgi:hypothetical protein
MAGQTYAAGAWTGINSDPEALTVYRFSGFAIPDDETVFSVESAAIGGSAELVDAPTARWFNSDDTATH